MARFPNDRGPYGVAGGMMAWIHGDLLPGGLRRGDLRRMVGASLLFHGLLAVGLAMGWMWHWKMEPMPDAELPSMEIEMVRTIGDGMVVKPQPVLPGPIPRRDIVEKPKLRDLPKPWAKRERPSEKGGAMPVPVPLSPNAPVEPSAPAQTPSPPLPIAETAAAPPMVVTVDTPGFPYGYYLRLIQKKVEERWRFPVSGGERSALIAFTIRSGGRVAGIFVESGSGDSYFDQTAIRAVAACDPFPPLPRGYPEGELRVHYRFQFHDRG